MPNGNNGKSSKSKVSVFESLNKKECCNANLKIYNLRYDFRGLNVESFISVRETNIITAIYMPFFLLLCVNMENKLRRKKLFSDDENHNMFE